MNNIDNYCAICGRLLPKCGSDIIPTKHTCPKATLSGIDAYEDKKDKLLFNEHDLNLYRALIWCRDNKADGEDYDITEFDIWT